MNRRPSSAHASSSASARDESRLTSPQLRLGSDRHLPPDPPAAGTVEPHAMSCSRIEPVRFGSGSGCSRSAARPTCRRGAGTGGLSEEVEDGGELDRAAPVRSSRHDGLLLPLPGEPSRRGCTAMVVGVRQLVVVRIFCAVVSVVGVHVLLVGVGQGQRFGRRPIGHSAGLELIRCCCCHKGSEKKRSGREGKSRKRIESFGN
jgi:hypothetical protein